MAYTPAQVSQINAARAANVAAGKNPYSGAGATAYSVSQGLGGRDTTAAPVANLDNQGVSDNAPPSIPTKSPTPDVTPQVPPTAPKAAVISPPTSPSQPAALTPEQQATNNSMTQSGNYTFANGSTGMASRYKSGLANAKASGQPAPIGGGDASTAMTKALPQAAQENSPEVQNFWDTNPTTSQISKDTLEWLSPKNTTDTLQKYVDQYASDRAELAGLKTELMNNKRLIGGTEDDIRTEVTKVGGFATDSQVRAMTLARNKYLIDDSARITDLIQSQQDNISTDVTLMGMAKDQANAQFNQRMSLLNYQQENQKFAYNAAKDQFASNLKLMGADGLYASMQGQPQMISHYEQMNGLAPGSLAVAAHQAATERAQSLLKSNLDIQNTQSEINKRNAEAAASTASDAAVNPDVLNGMLNVYKSTGVLPTFGQSAKSPLRAQFYAALGSPNGAQIVSDANTNKTVRAGLATAYKTQQNLLSANQTAIGTLDKQLDLVKSYSDKVDRSDSPLIAKYQIALKNGVFGDPDTAALNNIVKTASYEFAKILGGSAASIGGVSVQSAADAESMLNSSMTKGQFNSVMDLMKKEADFRLGSQKDTLASLQKDMNNVGNLTDSLKPITPSDIPSGYYQASDGLLYKK